MFEHRRQPLLPQSLFVRRLGRSALVALGIVLGSLALGVLGFHFLDQRRWIDAVLNSAMLLGGMGPVGDFNTDVGKLFGALYALYAGLVFLLVAGLLFAPLFHRILHRFHLETDDVKTDDQPTNAAQS